ncbi:MAG: hypothetical protein P0111_17530 [Nitrospira sp.]|nr:hypothetical protein [Nitrospira sp.]
MSKPWGLYGVAIAAGMIVWMLVVSFSGRLEAWDSELYFSVGIPAVCLVACILGYVEPERPWRWGIVPLIGQASWMLLSQGAGNLLPLGLVMFAILSIPSILAARLGATLANRKARSA